MRGVADTHGVGFRSEDACTRYCSWLYGSACYVYVHTDTLVFSRMSMHANYKVPCQEVGSGLDYNSNTMSYTCMETSAQIKSLPACTTIHK